MDLWRWRPQEMKRKSVRRQKRPVAKTVLRLPDLEIAKSAVLNSLSCPDARRGYAKKLVSVSSEHIHLVGRQLRDISPNIDCLVLKADGSFEWLDDDGPALL